MGVKVTGRGLEYPRVAGLIIADRRCLEGSHVGHTLTPLACQGAEAREDGEYHIWGVRTTRSTFENIEQIILELEENGRE